LWTSKHFCRCCECSSSPTFSVYPYLPMTTLCQCFSNQWTTIAERIQWPVSRGHNIWALEVLCCTSIISF
jgi:hypothetical protein